MSSVKKRIMIEEYHNGGYSISSIKKDTYGILNIEELKKE